jgi:hypothetical protein
VWRGMTRVEIEDFWCAPDPPVIAVYFDDKGGFSNYVCLMRDGTISAHLDSAAGNGLQVLASALAYFRNG